MDGTRWQGITPKQAVEKLEERLGQAHHDENKLRADLTAARLELEEARRQIYVDQPEGEYPGTTWKDVARWNRIAGDENDKLAALRTEERDAALADAERLRETVKNAPHAEGCVMLDVWPHNDRCTCWKSAALNPAEPKL